METAIREGERQGEFLQEKNSRKAQIINKSQLEERPNLQISETYDNSMSLPISTLNASNGNKITDKFSGLASFRSSASGSNGAGPMEIGRTRRRIRVGQSHGRSCHGYVRE